MTSGQKETSAVNPVSSPKPDKIVSQIELEFRSARRGELRGLEPPLNGNRLTQICC